MQAFAQLPENVTSDNALVLNTGECLKERVRARRLLPFLALLYQAEAHPDAACSSVPRLLRQLQWIDP